MPQTDPNLGLNYGWTLGESGWNAGMDANLKKLGAVVHLSVKSRAVSAPPASPANGDRYIIPASATGDWTGRGGQIAVRINNIWEYYAASVGWAAYVEDENKQVIYTSQGWTLVDDVLGLGTMANQNADNVNIVGGNINNAIIGNNIRTYGAFEKLGVGAPINNDAKVYLGGPVTGGTSKYGVVSGGEIQQDVTNTFESYRSIVNTTNAQFTITNLRHFVAREGTVGTNVTIQNQYGYVADGSLTKGNNIYGFYSNVPGGTGKWNFFAEGTAQSKFRCRTIFESGFARVPTVSTAPDGSTITLTYATNHLLYNNSNLVASLTINLPAESWLDGQEITIATRSAITALTVSAGSTPVYGAPTTLPAGGFATFIYSAAAGAWFRKG